MKKTTKKDTAFYIFSSACSFLSVYVFALLRQLSGDPVMKLLTDILIIFLLVTLNTTVLVLYEIVKKNRRDP